MNFISKLFKRKKTEDKKDYSCNLEKLLAESGIPYDIEQVDDTICVFYIDAMDRQLYKFEYVNDILMFNGKEIDEKEAYRLMEIKWRTDSLIIKYMEDENYCDIFDIAEFFSGIVSENGLIDKLVPLKDGKGIRLYYNIGKMPTETDFIAGIEQSVSKGGISTFKIMPTNMQTDANGAALEVFRKIYNNAPAFFTSGQYKVPEEMRFTDIVKTYRINLETVAKLNTLADVEAQLSEVNSNIIIFVMFKNGSALEYLTPTKQQQRGRLLIIDLDEENLTEDNDSYGIVLKILQLTERVKDKPDEDRMPKRKFTKNGKENRRF